MSKTKFVKIEKLDDKGFGVARVGKKELKIAYVLPEERVKIVLLNKTKKPIIPLLVVDKSDKRTKPLCPYFGICGGCLWQHIKYSHQLELKQQKVEELFSNIVKRNIEFIIKADKQWRYRNKMEFSFDGSKNSIQIGLKMIGRFDKVINLETCLIQNSQGDRIIRVVREFANDERLEPYDNVKHTGFLRFLVIRTSVHFNDIMANLVTTTSGTLNVETLANKLKISSVIWSTTDSLADIAIGKINSIIGRNYIRERLCRYTFRIYPYSFFQTNPFQAEKAFKLMKDIAGTGDVALDLYSGVGTISLIVSENFKEVIGIEINGEAVIAAKMNAVLNEVHNTEFIEGAVEDILNSNIKKKVDVLFIDPPRAGMNKRVLSAIIHMAPKRIIYLSCNPKTQARDVKYLIKHYDIDLIQPIDFFPHTPHIENLVVLSKK